MKKFKISVTDETIKKIEKDYSEMSKFYKERTTLEEHISVILSAHFKERYACS